MENSEREAAARPQPSGRSTIVTPDGIRLSVHERGHGRPVVFLSAWTFSSEIWDPHMAALATRGCRCVAYDRRGHGGSDEPGRGYDADTLADDLAAVLDHLDLRDVTLVAYSMGSVEAVRYLSRHGSARIARLVLVAPVTPFLTETPDNPCAVPLEALEAMRGAIAADFPGWLAENEAPFFTPETPQEMRDRVREMMLSVALSTVLACHRTLTGTDLRDELGRIDRPTLVLQGDHDASAPLPLTGTRTAALIPTSRLVIYEGAPHALPLTHRERFLADVAAFIES